MQVRSEDYGCAERGGAYGSCRAAACEERAQATLEYALAMAAFMAIVTGLALLWRVGADGTLARLVEEAASHALEGTGLLDIALY